MNSVIRFGQVSKSYKLGNRKSNPSVALTWLTSRFGKRPESDSERVFWALNNVSFDIAPGEIVGIVGHNGAGKTTVLKLLSRVAQPTNGWIEVNARTSALIELGAGFHPDLTGRENVYLNAAILGLSRKETANRFDQIVAFSELENFIDTPVKRYSSGMYVRLGFSVAAHIDPQILLVDEVLAVGDMKFQRKCMARMGELRRTDTTIVFVSHNLSAVEDLCDRVIWLNEGQIREDGPVDSVVRRYMDWMNTDLQLAGVVGYSLKGRWGTGEVRVIEVQIETENGVPQGSIKPNSPIWVRLKYHAKTEVQNPVFWIALADDDHGKICGTTTSTSGHVISAIYDTGEITCCIPQVPLRPGVYFLIVGVLSIDGRISYDRWGQAATLIVLQDEHKTYDRDYLGFVHMDADWQAPDHREVPSPQYSHEPTLLLVHDTAGVVR